MSDVDPTPSTPVTIGDRLGWFRGELRDRLIQLAGDPATDLADLAASLEALQGTPAASLREVITTVTDLRGTSNTNLGQLLSEAQYVSAQTQLQSRLLDIREDLDVIKAALGASPYGDLELASARGLLNAILTTLRNREFGTPPISVSGDVPSNGTIVLSGRRYALFLPPIQGVTVASNGYDLSRSSGSWLGWNAYIQTTDPEPRINTATDIPNQWLALAGSGSVNFNVSQQYPITVYLRPPANSGYIWYWDLGEINQVSTGAGNRWLPTTSKYPDLTFINFNANAPRCLSTNTNFGNWRWEITTPGPQSVYGFNALSVVLSTGSGTVPAGTTNRWVVQSTTQPTAGTYIRIYPPT